MREMHLFHISSLLMQSRKERDYLVFDKKEIDSVKPESTKLIEVDRFMNFFRVDPYHFERTWHLITNNSDRLYPLLRKLLERPASPQ